jgi:O-antigen/teichoic acid export membrane protein
MSNSLRHRAVQGFWWHGGSRAVTQGVSWIITLAVARMLTPADYGLMGMALLYIGLIEFLNDMGLGTAIVQCKDISREQLHSLFWFSIAVGLFYFGLTLTLAPLVAMFFHQPALTHLLWFVGLIHVISSLQQVPWNILTRDVDFKRRAIGEASGSLISGVITVVLAWRGWGVWALAWGLLSRNLITMIMVFLQTGWRPELIFNWVSLKPLLRFSLTLISGRLAYFAHSSSPSLIIGKWFGDQALGFYSLSVRLTTEIGERVLAVVNQVSFPVYSRMQGQSQRLKQSYLTSVEVVCACVFPLLGGLILVADDAIPLLLGPKWVPMIGPFKFLAASGWFGALFSLSGPAVLAKSGPRPSLYINMLLLAVLPASFYIGAKHGLAGLCWVWVTLYPVLVLGWIFWHKRIIGYQWSEYWNALRPAVVGTIVMMAAVAGIRVVFLTGIGPLPSLAVTVVLGALVYAAAFFSLLARPFGELVEIVMPSKDTPQRGA